MLVKMLRGQWVSGRFFSGWTWVNFGPNGVGAWRKAFGKGTPEDQFPFKLFLYPSDHESHPFVFRRYHFRRLLSSVIPASCWPESLFLVIYGLPRLRKQNIQLRGDGCCHISGFCKGTLLVPSLHGCRTADPMHSLGLTNQPMTIIRVCCRRCDRVRPSVGFSCYAILGEIWVVLLL